MIELCVRSHFSGAHHLEGYNGSCSDHHGHNWGVEVCVQGDRLNDMGIVIDYRILKQMLKDVLNVLDHKDLNVSPVFSGINPSSENIARYIYEQMKKQLAGQPCEIVRVTVNETPETSATYREG
jgi:6-pyruvoyltetrahydropterin/6-carboxytetrahydropterin synthase